MIRSVNAICSMGAAALSLALASSAGAATNVGSAFPPTDACSEDTTTIQTTSPGDAYAAPSDGVITRWSYYAASSPPPSVRLKVGRAVPGSDLSSPALGLGIVGESAPQTVSASQLNTYPTRVPLKSGDFIGLYLGGALSVLVAIARTG